MTLADKIAAGDVSRETACPYCQKNIPAEFDGYGAYWHRVQGDLIVYAAVVCRDPAALKAREARDG